MNGSTFLFDSSRDIVMATILGAKSAKLAYSLSCVAMAFRHGLGYRNSDLRILNDNNVSTLQINLVTFGPITSEFTRLKLVQQASINTQLV